MVNIKARLDLLSEIFIETGRPMMHNGQRFANCGGGQKPAAYYQMAFRQYGLLFCV